MTHRRRFRRLHASAYFLQAFRRHDVASIARNGHGGKAGASQSTNAQRFRVSLILRVVSVLGDPQAGDFGFDLVVCGPAKVNEGAEEDGGKEEKGQRAACHAVKQGVRLVVRFVVFGLLVLVAAGSGHVRALFVIYLASCSNQKIFEREWFGKDVTEPGLSRIMQSTATLSIFSAATACSLDFFSILGMKCDC